MGKRYYIEIDEKRIGYTEFEYADPTMGVVHGKITFNQIVLPYDFFKSYCLAHNIQINYDYPEDRLIATHVIPQLKVYLETGEELLGGGGAVTIMEPGDFNIEFFGVSYESMLKHFNHHNLE